MSNRYVVKPADVEALQYFNNEDEEGTTGANNVKSVMNFLGEYSVEYDAGVLYVFDVKTKDWYEVNDTDYVVRFNDGSVEVWTSDYFTDNYVPAPPPASTVPNWFPNTTPGILHQPYVATWNEHYAGNPS